MATTALSITSFQPQSTSSLAYGVEQHHHHHQGPSISRELVHSIEQHHSQLSSPPQLSRPSHTCPSCSRPFSRAEHLERHLATHLPSNSSKCFVCQSCLKGFTRKDVLKRHIRAVHERKRSDIRRSRRRSCKRCAGFKIKCTGIGRNLSTDGTGTTDEACEACKKRGVDCVYDFRATAPENPSTESNSPQESYPYDDYSESDPSRRGSAESADETKTQHTGYSSEPTTPSPQSISISSILHLTDLPPHSNRRQMEAENCPRSITEEDRRTSASFQDLLSSPSSSTPNRQLSSLSLHQVQEANTLSSVTSSLPVSFLVNGNTTTEEGTHERTWGHGRTVVVARSDHSISTRPRAASDAAIHLHHGNGGDTTKMDGYGRRDTMAGSSMRHNIAPSMDYDHASAAQPGRLETSLSRPQSSHYSTFSSSYEPNTSVPSPPPPPPISAPAKAAAIINTQLHSNPLYSTQTSPTSDQAPRSHYHRTHSIAAAPSPSSGNNSIPISEYRPTAIFQNTYPHAPRSSAPQHQQAGQWVWQPAGTSGPDIQRVTLPPLRHLLNECDGGAE